MDLQLKGRNCVVIGATRGIGLAIARGLAAEGANVGICGRTDASLASASHELQQAGVRVHAAPCDAANPEAIAGFLDGAREALGSVDVLVHNASALAVGPDLGAWAASVQVDLMGAVHACERVIPWMMASGGGSILLVSSIAGLEVTPMSDYAYTSVKAALIAYAKKLAVLQAPHKIRVNAISPGSIEFAGGIWANVKQGMPDLYNAVLASIPSGRLGTPEEVADLAVYLVSPRANWITGECVSVDGGQHRGMR